VLLVLAVVEVETIMELEAQVELAAAGRVVLPQGRLVLERLTQDQAAAAADRLQIQVLVVQES
tara:strand:+ start:635 stop:823 length:189 start_codon:yes stop_codon:yes gene_type:complete